MTNYKEEIVDDFNVADVWEGLVWSPLPRNEKHFEWEKLDEQPGLYRARLLERVEFNQVFHIGEQEISISALEENAILSIGKTKDLKQRLSKQHFSGNSSGNRLGRHLAKIFPDNGKGHLSLTDIFNLDKVAIEYVIEECWWKRDLLESYGKVHHKCLFDLGVEH